MAKTFTKFRSDLDEDILSLLEDDETELKVQAKTPGVAASLPTDEDELEDDDYAEWETVDAIPQTYVRGKNGTVTHHDEGVGQKGAEIPEAEMAEDLDEADEISEVLNQDDIHEPGSRANQDTKTLELNDRIRQRSPEYRREQAAKKKRRDAERAAEKADPGGIKRGNAERLAKAKADAARRKKERLAAKKSGKEVPSPYTAHAGTDRARPAAPRKSRAGLASDYTPDNHGEALDETDSLHPDDLKRVNKTHPGSPQSRAKTRAEYDAPRTRGDVGDDINRAKEIKRLKAARRARELASDYTPDHGETLGEEETINELSKKTLASYIQKAVGDIGVNNRVKGHRGGVSRGVEMATGKTAPKGPSNKRINRELLNRNAGVAQALKKLLKQGDEILDHDETFAEANEVIFTKKEKKAAAKRAKKNRKTRADKRKANEPDDSDYDKGNYPGYWGRKPDGSPADEDYHPSFKEFRDSFKEEPVYENVMDSLKKIVSRNQKSSLTFEDGTGTDVDPKQATNILQVYGALSKNNQPKMAAMIAKDGAGFSKALSFAQSHDGESHLATTEL